MSSKRLLFAGLLLGLLGAVFALPVLAATSIDSVAFYCDHIDVTYSSDDSMGQDDAVITITNLDTASVIYQSKPLTFLYDVFGGTYTINFPVQPTGSNLMIEVMAGATASATGVCASSGSGSEGGIDYEAIAFGDGRFCFGRGEANAALFAFNDGLVVYEIDGEAGTLVIDLSASELAEIPTKPESNMLIASSPNELIQFYRLHTGQYQLNVGPDEEGKVHVCIFSTIPDRFARTFSYFPGE